MNETTKKSVILWWSLHIFLWLGSLAFLLFALSWRMPPKTTMPDVGDLMTIFFGVSSLALVAFSLLFAAAALVQWGQLQAEVRRFTAAGEATLAKVDTATQTNEERVNALDAKIQKSNEKLEQELRGRVDAVMGAMIGTLHSKPDSDTQTPDDLNYIAEAIHHCEAGYARLEKLEGNGKYMALHNLVYFSCLANVQGANDDLLLKGRQLKDIGRQHKDKASSAPYLMTFCRVALLYSSDRSEIEQARGIAKSLERMKLTSLQAKEAAYLAASLEDKLQEMAMPS